MGYLTRFASLRGGTTKQSRDNTINLDCFVPRSDAERIKALNRLCGCKGTAFSFK